MLLGIYYWLMAISLYQSPKKDSFNYRYTKVSYGNSLFELNAKDNTQKFYGNSFDSSFNISLFKSNHYVGPSVKSYYNENLKNLSYGVNYSYLFFFENKSFLSFSLFLGKGRLNYNNEYGQRYLSSTTYFLQKFAYDSNFLSPGYLLGYNSGYIQYNFLEITPSVSFEIPIFDESGFNLALELFASRKIISNKYKNEFFDNIYLNSNEVGFRFGITKLN